MSISPSINATLGQKPYTCSKAGIMLWSFYAFNVTVTQTLAELNSLNIELI